MTEQDYDFLVGKILGFHGLGGQVKIKPETNTPELLLELKRVRVELAPGMGPLRQAVKEQKSDVLKLASAKLDKKMLVVSFKDHDDRTSVEYLEGANLYCRKADLLPLEDDEFWVRDLVGIDVFTTGGAHIGKVISIVYGGNDLLEVQRESDPAGKTVLIPFVQELVPFVDLKGNRIEVVDVPGLLEAQ